MPDSMESISTKRDTQSAGSASSSGVRILAVDDNEALRYSLVRSLRDAGYEVVEAGSGREALALAATQPDLITLDVNLPDMSGFQVCRQLKEDPATSHIPILHVSSTFVDPNSRVHGLTSGADGYLAEPIDRAELVATVGALLRLKRAETAARQQAEAAEAARQELARVNANLEARVDERTEELRTANQSLRELSARLLQTQDTERRHIARELHDSVGQLLAAMSMNMGVLELESETLSARALKAFNENRTLLSKVTQDVRTMSYLLHPPLLDEAGLASALAWYVDGFSRRSGIAVTLDCSPTLGRLPIDLETAIFRIVQECLGNVHRHAQSLTAAIRLEANNGGVNLVVSDAGRGIPNETQHQLNSGDRRGVGLRGMRERVTQLGGQLQINSSEAGTTVTAQIP